MLSLIVLFRLYWLKIIDNILFLMSSSKEKLKTIGENIRIIVWKVFLSYLSFIFCIEQNAMPCFTYRQDFPWSSQFPSSNRLLILSQIEDHHDFPELLYPFLFPLKIIFVWCYVIIPVHVSFRVTLLSGMVWSWNIRNTNVKSVCLACTFYT